MLRVFLNGYSDSAGTELAASGSSAWMHVEPGASLTVELCFCSLDRLTAGDCSCS
jgi:hypothetical protein